MDDDLMMEDRVGQLLERAGRGLYGKYRGIVTDVDDPENLCRIRVRVAALGDLVCGWALPAAPFAGDGHGFVMLPKPRSGVWVEFEAGNIDVPIWSGAWWASGQRPEPQGSRVRVIVSETGHKLVLDDEAGEVRITHGGGPEIKLTGSEITITVGACQITVGSDNISLNNGLVKVGLAGVSLVGGALSIGVPP
jgi:phage baseplate assembly protein gpV